MKKYLPKIDLLTVIAAAVGILLRLWLLAVGTDENELYPAGHISDVLLLLLSIALTGTLFLVAGYAGRSRTYQANFRASLPGAVGYAVLGIGLLPSAVRYLTNGTILLDWIAGISAIPAAVALLWGGFCRWKGRKPHYLTFALPLLFFALHLFCMGHAWGNEPELTRFFVSFVACAACVPACYQLWAFSVDLGNRSASLFWSLLAAYFCLVSVPGSEHALLYLAEAIWLLTNLCPKKPPVRRAAARPAPQPPIASEPTLPGNEPTRPDAEPTIVRPDDPEINAILADILRELNDGES